MLLTSASLIIDYILTVAVSVSTVAVAISSAFPVLDDYSVRLALGLLALLMIINLRGVKSKIIVGIYQYNHNSLQTFTHTKNQLDQM